MAQDTRQLKGYPLTFNIYAESEEEVDECRKEIIAFIGYHASQCRAVTARKVAQALKNWDKNIFVRNKINEHFK